MRWWEGSSCLPALKDPSHRRGKGEEKSMTLDRSRAGDKATDQRQPSGNKTVESRPRRDAHKAEPIQKGEKSKKRKKGETSCNQRKGVSDASAEDPDAPPRQVHGHDEREAVKETQARLHTHKRAKQAYMKSFMASTKRKKHWKRKQKRSVFSHLQSQCMMQTRNRDKKPGTE